MSDDVKKLIGEFEKVAKDKDWHAHNSMYPITTLCVRYIDTILAGLRAVEKLPKTADGVWIVPGMEVWSGKSGTRHVVKSVSAGTFKVICDCHGEEIFAVSNDVPVYSDGKAVPMPIRMKVFSTEAAALAAQQAENGGGR
jgi:hypothetical protein